ncbi:hypothetical protein DFH09DRAFT_1079358 [Mycena vulgaris]|nr:hypothetical protein DFH09DRAFT_1079358 [Mycena vulgaris]
MDSLAQELIDAIIEEVEVVDQDNSWVRVTRSLKSCAFVATRFRVTSQRRLFHSANFGLETRNKALKGLIRRPHLAAYVCDLQISLGDGVGNDYDLFTAAFPLFIGVQRFVISATGKWYQNAPPHLRVALFSLVSFPTLRCIAFHCPSAPSPLILHALVLCEVVALDPFDIGRECSNSPCPLDARIAWTQKAPTAKLGRLVLKYSPTRSAPLHAFMLDAAVELHLTNMHSLQLTAPTRASLGGYEIFASKYSHSIQHLVIDFGMLLHREDTNSPPFALPTMPDLRSLKFQGEMRGICIPTPLMSAIPSLPLRMPRLEVLTFAFSGGWEEDARTERCVEADEALKSLKHLRELRFDINPDEEDGSFARADPGMEPFTVPTIFKHRTLWISLPPRNCESSEKSSSTVCPVFNWQSGRLETWLVKVEGCRIVEAVNTRGVGQTELEGTKNDRTIVWSFKSSH